MKVENLKVSSRYFKKLIMDAKKKEIYAICGIQKKSINLIVTIYKESQFYILFNEKKILIEKKQNSFFYQGRILKSLVKEAEKKLNIKINKVSYNIPIEDIKIEKYEYFYHFSKTITLNQEILKNINDKFLKNYQKKENYQNFFFKVNNYYLIEEKKVFNKPPFGEKINSLKIDGYLYRVHWKILSKYMQIIKFATLKPDFLLLLPYAIYMGLLFGQKKDNLLIVDVDKETIRLYLFENRIFTKHITLKLNLKEAITKISQKNKCEYLDVKKYLYNFFSLDDELLINRFNFFNEKENNKIQNLMKTSRTVIANFLQNLINEINFVLNEKWKMKKTNTSIFLLGKILKIGGIIKYIEKKDPHKKWKISQNAFLGIEDEKDLYLIGNAYCHHLQNKINFINEKE